MSDTPGPQAGSTPNASAQPAATQAHGDLSEAAREAVRQPADPRIDTHLAHLGLTDEPSPRRSARARAVTPAALTAAEPPAPASPDLTPEVELLRARTAALETALAAAARRTTILAGALVAVAIIAIAGLLLALR